MRPGLTKGIVIGCSAGLIIWLVIYRILWLLMA